MSTVEDFAKHRIQEEGAYRAFPIARTIEKADSGAVAIAWKFAIWSRWHGKEHGWSEQYAMGWYVEGRVWIVKKDGNVSEGAVRAQQACGLWDGDWDKLDDSVPIPQVFVLIDVEKEEYEGRDQFKVAWVNPDAAEPRPRGQFAPVEKGLLNQLRSKYQSKTRAIAGGGAPPSGPPPAPPGLPGAPVVNGPPTPSGLPGAAAPTAGPSAPPAPTIAPPAGPPGAPPQPPAWGGSAPTAHPTQPPGSPAPPGAITPPPVAPDGSKPPF